MKRFIFIATIILSSSCSKNRDSIAIPFDDRNLFMALTPFENNYDLSEPLDEILTIGFDGPGDINLEWSSVEIYPGEYTDPDGVLEWSRKNLKGIPINLTLSPIQTTALSIPEDLKTKAWTDQEIEDRALGMIQFIAKELEELSIKTVSFGNEVDIFFQDDMDDFEDYLDLYENIKTELKNSFTEADVGIKLTSDFLDQNQMLTERIKTGNDVGLFTYYPAVEEVNTKNRILNDFEKMVNAFSPKKIHILETGFPSSAVLNSSEELQVKFVENIFESWDTYHSEIPSITFVWLHDLSGEVLNYFKELYGTDSADFIAFLGSLGYKKNDGAEKLAYGTIKENIDLRK